MPCGHLCVSKHGKFICSLNSEYCLATDLPSKVIKQTESLDRQRSTAACRRNGRQQNFCIACIFLSSTSSFPSASPAAMYMSWYSLFFSVHRLRFSMSCASPHNAQGLHLFIEYRCSLQALCL